MLTVTNGFVGHDKEFRNTLWSGSDSLENYTKNLKQKPHDWYYRNREIYYNRNTLGHRCKDIQEIDINNYILFIGCSQTEGIGLELEKTFPYLVAKHLNIDYYNLGVGGAGLDVMSHNLCMWFSTVKIKPKLLVVQWSDINRFVLEKDNSLATAGPWCVDSDITRFMVSGSSINFFNTRRMLINELVTKLSENIPTVHLVWPSTQFNDKQHVIKKFDEARDALHFGIISNMILADFIISSL